MLLRISRKPKQPRIIIQYTIPLFTKIISNIEKNREQKAIRIIPLFAALTTLQLEEGNSQNCQVSCENLRSLCTEVLNLPPNATARIQFTRALFQIEKVFLTLEKRDPHSFNPSNQ